MKRKDKDWNTRLAQHASQGDVRFRNRRVVVPLVVLTLALLAVGLFAAIGPGRHHLSMAAFAAAAVAGAALLLYFLDRRLRVTPPPQS